MFSAHRIAGCLVVISTPLVGWLYAQQPRVVAPQGGYQYYYNPLEQSIQWLRNEQIQKEIELVPEQLQKIDKIRKDYYAKTQQMYKDLRGTDQTERWNKLNQMRKKLSKEVERQVREVLLKHQVERIQQIMLQRALRQYGSTRALTSDEIAKALNITKQQKTKLREVEQQARQKMQKKYREFYEKLREEMLEEVLRVLDEKQRAQLKTMMGRDFELKPVPWRPAAPRGTSQGT
jgi:hypothetical protein